MNSALELKLTKQLPGFTLDLDCSMGNELAVLFGYSGSGKSMTLNMLAGLVRPDAGYIRCMGETLYDSEGAISLPPQRRRIGYVLQDSALFPHMSIRRNIEYAMIGGTGGIEHGRIAWIMDALQIAHLAWRFPSEISGGQRQRVALARALACRPRIILMDEPFSALDKHVRLQMRRLVLEVRREFEIPVLLVTHDLDEAARMADTIFIYSEGCVVQSGSPSEIIRNPHTDAVRELVHSNLSAL